MAKIQIFHEALPMRGTLFRMGVQLNPSCPICLEDIELIDHLFFDCFVTGKYESVLFSMDGSHKIICRLVPRSCEGSYSCLGRAKPGGAYFKRSHFSYGASEKTKIISC